MITTPTWLGIDCKLAGMVIVIIDVKIIRQEWVTGYQKFLNSVRSRSRKEYII